MDGNTTHQHGVSVNAAEIMPSTPIQTATDPVNGEGEKQAQAPAQPELSSSEQNPYSKSQIDPNSLEAGTRHSNVVGSAVLRDRGGWGNFIDSFKRAEPLPSKGIEVTEGAQGVTPTSVGGFDHKTAAEKTANSGLDRALKSRHMQMIAIGGSIGTGLFVTSGAALSIGGPASLISAYGIIGVLIFCTMQSLGELATLYPVAGSFSAYSTRFLDPAWGFAMGWNYAIQWLVVLPLEIVAASITLNFWPETRNTNSAAWVSIFLVIIVAINFFGVKGYGEAEFVFAIVKIVAVIGFVILGIVINAGGAGHEGYLGGRYWQPGSVRDDYFGYLNGQAAGSIHSGAFNAGFKGLCSVLVVAAFSFAGTELVGLAAAESSNPRKTLPKAIKQVFWRIVFFYMTSLIIISLLVPYGDSRLLGGESSSAKASPFVIAINNAGIRVLPSIFNAVILTAVLSVGNSSVYGSSRTLAALADQGQAPKFFGYVDRQGRPLFSIIFASAMGFLCFVVAGGENTATITLKWLYSLCGLSTIFTWGSICLCHIRFRKAWKLSGYGVEDLPYRSQVGIWGSWLGLILNLLVLVAQFWTAIWPIGYAEKTSQEIAENFFLACLAAPVVLMFYFSYKFTFKTSVMRTEDMDITTGRRDLDAEGLIEDEKAAWAAMPRWKRGYRTLC